MKAHRIFIYKEVNKVLKFYNGYRYFFHILLIIAVLALAAAVVFFTLERGRPGFIQPPTCKNAVLEEKPDRVKIAAVGDIMLSRRVGRLMADEGVMYPWEKISGKLQSADLVFGNLESPVSSRGEPLPGKGIWFRAAPETVKGLKKAGFHVLSVANNHILDFKEPAFLDTLDLLRQEGLHPVGGGSNLAEARSPVVVERHGLKIAFLAYSEMADIYWSRSEPRSLSATEKLCGIAPAHKEIILEDIEEAKSKADHVVVSMHWGEEYKDTPTEKQRLLAHDMIDKGADIIIGHHPHVLQGLEVYKNGVIAYSLGNFVFDQYWAGYTQEALLVEFDISALGCTGVEVWPIVLPSSQPRLAKGQEAAPILNKTRLLSSELGTLIEIEDGKGIISMDSGQLTE